MKNAILTFLLFTAVHAFAGSSTWVGATSFYWSYDDHWSPQSAPENPGDVATFAATGVNNCFVNSSFNIDSIVFAPDAQDFSLTISGEDTLLGQGIINNSGRLQSFTLYAAGFQSSLQGITFEDSASAGDLTKFTVLGSVEGDIYGGALLFYDQANAGSAVINNEPTKDSDYSGANFYDESSAATATITNEAAGSSEEGGASYDGGSTWFGGDSTAGNATIVNQGTNSPNGAGGMVYFADNSDAGSSTIICEGSVGEPSYPASVWFTSDSHGGKCRVILQGDGTLNTWFRSSTGKPFTVNIGSLEGNGIAVVSASDLGAVVLSVGSNNLDTKFDGLIEEVSYVEGSEASLQKVGMGKLVLTNANTYHGGTVVESGVLLVDGSHIDGSPTGSGKVLVRGGTFGGAGSVAGPVTVGTGNGKGAILAPGKEGKSSSLTITNSLILNAAATLKTTLNTSRLSADSVNCSGVKINHAQAVFDDPEAGVVPLYTTFTILQNTSPNRIKGTFSNLADGATITVKLNKYLVSYKGGDGNDLTLTAIP